MTIEEISAHLHGRTPRLTDEGRGSAVLVPLVETAEGLRLLFEVRADTLASQPGEVCFPGGRLEGDESAINCALRETWEELGILPEQIAVLAELDWLWRQSGASLVYPILGRVDPAALSSLRLEPAEVKETFTVPLDFFLHTPPVIYPYELVPHVGDHFPYSLIGFPGGYSWRRTKSEIPIWSWQGHAIWGLTGRMICGLIKLLNPCPPPRS